MIKKNVQKAMELTIESLNHFWKQDINFVLSLCAEDVYWLGSMPNQFMGGIHAMTEDFQQMVPYGKLCHILNQNFRVVQNNGETCTIAGECLISTDADVEQDIQTLMHYTYIWQMIEKQLKIKFIQASNTIDYVPKLEEDNFLNTMGKSTRQYLENKEPVFSEQQKLTVTDENRCVRFVYVAEVLSVSAYKKQAMLHTLNGDIFVRRRFANVMEELGDDFVEVHRGHAVNMNYVEKIYRYEVLMSNGDKIAIPVKRYNSLLEDIERCNTRKQPEKSLGD